MLSTFAASDFLYASESCYVGAADSMFAHCIYVVPPMLWKTMFAEENFLVFFFFPPKYHFSGLLLIEKGVCA